MSTQTASRVGTFVWHENVTDDPKSAQEFYTQLFGGRSRSSRDPSSSTR